ncbi:hypothetical protein A0J57_10995 [Sphingobium sp. 22B]|nr:hypothetical protein AXW74_07590 [Sphingobium sp. AM]KYC32185.1 hypothetical protein A0J57_10995 [Sphingobium sp. 22B]OAP31817.1 hypothetical protein A8O16_10795 [Sphingobium sp. 20006FA]
MLLLAVVAHAYRGNVDFFLLGSNDYFFRVHVDLWNFAAFNADLRHVRGGLAKLDSELSGFSA